MVDPDPDGLGILIDEIIDVLEPDYTVDKETGAITPGTGDPNKFDPDTIDELEEKIKAAIEEKKNPTGEPTGTVNKDIVKELVDAYVGLKEQFEVTVPEGYELAKGGEHREIDGKYYVTKGGSLKFEPIDESEKITSATYTEGVTSGKIARVNTQTNAIYIYDVQGDITGITVVTENVPTTVVPGDLGGGTVDPTKPTDPGVITISPEPGDIITEVIIDKGTDEEKVIVPPTDEIIEKIIANPSEFNPTPVIVDKDGNVVTLPITPEDINNKKPFTYITVDPETDRVIKVTVDPSIDEGNTFPEVSIDEVTKVTVEPILNPDHITDVTGKIEIDDNGKVVVDPTPGEEPNDDKITITTGVTPDNLIKEIIKNPSTLTPTPAIVDKDGNKVDYPLTGEEIEKKPLTFIAVDPDTGDIIEVTVDPTKTKPDNEVSIDEVIDVVIKPVKTEPEADLEEITTGVITVDPETGVITVDPGEGKDKITVTIDEPENPAEVTWITDPTDPDNLGKVVIDEIGDGKHTIDAETDKAEYLINTEIKDNATVLFSINEKVEHGKPATINVHMGDGKEIAAMLNQDIVSTASNETVIYFLTSVHFPIDSNHCYEYRKGTAFERKTGAIISNEKLFSCSSEEAIQTILDIADITDLDLRGEMKNAFSPENIIIFPDNLEVSFPQDTLPSQEYTYILDLDYDDRLCKILHQWAIPKKQ